MANLSFISNIKNSPIRIREREELAELAGRLTAAQAGYMELTGAKKDGDCHKVYVEDGISKKLGCCNEFNPQSSMTNRFRCGDCIFLKGDDK